MSEEALPGGNTHGAVRIGGVVHKQTSPWTPTVHALLRHLEQAGVDGVRLDQAASYVEALPVAFWTRAKNH